jgi:hypothetical protein
MFFKPARGLALLQEGSIWADPGSPDLSCFRGLLLGEAGSRTRAASGGPRPGPTIRAASGGLLIGEAGSRTRAASGGLPQKTPDSSCFRRAPSRGSRLSGSALLLEGSTSGRPVARFEMLLEGPLPAPSCFRRAPSGAGSPYIPAFLNRGNYRGSFQNIVILVCVPTLERISLTVKAGQTIRQGQGPSCKTLRLFCSVQEGVSRRTGMLHPQALLQNFK